jgi:signal transduction histidine kinase
MPIALKYGVVYAVAIGLLVLLALVAHDGTARFRQASDAADRSQELINQLDGLRGGLIDIETGSRGFVITGDPKFLEPYQTALAVVPGRLAAIDGLIDRNTVQGQYFDDLRDIVRQRLDQSAKTIALRGSAGFEAAAEAVKSGVGKRLMDQIRDAIATMIASERAHLVQRDAQTVESFNYIKRVSISGAGVVSAFILICGGLLVRGMNRRIGQLVDAAGKLGAGKFDHRLVVKGQDEIAVLGRAFNQMADQLLEHKDALDSFAYTVAHDLRAPLRSMQGFSQALIEDCAEQLDDQGRDYATRVIAAARKMDGLIQDLLAYSRIGRTQMDVQRVPLDRVVNGALASLAAIIDDTGAEVHVERPLPSVRAFGPMLEQVVTNLVGNAVKFAKAGMKADVRVSAETRNGAVRLWVADNGIGIEPDHHQRIFKVFERLHGTESYPGTGIGLAIVRKGMERMGGRSGVESSPGQGSRFWIELPRGEIS